MHRAMSSIVLKANLDFGFHINSLGWNKATTKAAKKDMAKVLCQRKQNHFYTKEHRPQPRNGSDSPFFMDASYANMIGKQRDFTLNPSGLMASFVAINIEDETVDAVAQKARRILSPYFRGVENLPVFVPLRSLRSIALSRKKWIEKKGDSHIMASGFRSTNIDVWKDHYRCVENRQSGDGTRVVGLHYGEAVKTSGQSVVDTFSASTEGFIDTLKRQPKWIRGSVLSDGHGSSFVGSGNNKAGEVQKSLEDRVARLEEFAHLFEQCPEAAEHAERYGEL